MGLILSRREGESFHIGKDIRVQVIKVRSGRAMIKIDAPEMNIVRDELTEDASKKTETRLKQKEEAKDVVADADFAIKVMDQLYDIVTRHWVRDRD